MGGDLLFFFVGTSTLAGIYAIFTLGLNVQIGYTGLANLGHVAFFAIGAYVSVILTIPRPGTDVAFIVGYGLPMWVGVAAAALAAGLFAFLIGLPILKIGEEFFLVVTFAFSEVLRYFLINEKWLTNGPTGFYGLDRPWRQYFSPSGYEVFFLFLVVVALVVSYLVSEKICRSPFGRLLKGVRENEPLCQALGKDTFRAKMKSFVIGAMLAGVAGSLYARYTTLIVPGMFTPYVTFIAWWGVMMGGIGNNLGSIIGSFIFVFADQITLFLQVSGEYAVKLSSLRAVIMGVLLILILRFMPKGVLKEKRTTYR
ncbi:MAG: branched-chain amino acid ABC transporter permease [Thermodesulfobacteriota bacterium]